MRELLGLHLSNAGYDVTLAEDGVIGGNLVLRQPPDMLIVDVHMPYLNGIDLVCAMRAEPQLQRLPIIVISSREQYEQAALLLGAQYLLKPFSKDDLLSTVAAFFRVSSSQWPRRRNDEENAVGSRHVGSLPAL